MITLLNKILIIFLAVAGLSALYAQSDDLDDIKLTQEQWEAVRDTFAIYAIKHLARIDTLNLEIDSLKALNEKLKSYDCENELYALVGATKEQVADFRRKFDETEKKINSRTSTPEDARKYYFDEIYNSKIRCLPEFAERYNKMYSVISNIVVTENITETPTGDYIVKKGDHLWRISNMKYSTPYLWNVIWEANKPVVHNPNLLYEGMVLKIPELTEKQINEYKEKYK